MQNERRQDIQKRRPSQSATGAPRPESYSKPLQDKIRYVQYIPKEARGTIEDAVNQLYHQKEIHRRINGNGKNDNDWANDSQLSPTR